MSLAHPLVQRILSPQRELGWVPPLLVQCVVLVGSQPVLLDSRQRGGAPAPSLLDHGGEVGEEEGRGGSQGVHGSR